MKLSENTKLALGDMVRRLEEEESTLMILCTPGKPASLLEKVQNAMNYLDRCIHNIEEIINNE